MYGEYTLFIIIYKGHQGGQTGTYAGMLMFCCSESMIGMDSALTYLSNV